MQQDLAIALRAQDRRRNLRGNLVPALLGKLAEVAQDSSMLFGVAHDATLPHRTLPDLELRLDQRHHLAGRAEQIAYARQHQAQGDERDIDHGQVRWDWQLLEVPDVDPLQDGDPWVLAKAPGQLPVADVDGDHPRGTPLQQDVR